MESSSVSTNRQEMLERVEKAAVRPHVTPRSLVLADFDPGSAAQLRALEREISGPRRSWFAPPRTLKGPFPTGCDGTRCATRAAQGGDRRLRELGLRDRRDRRDQLRAAPAPRLYRAHVVRPGGRHPRAAGGLHDRTQKETRRKL